MVNLERDQCQAAALRTASECPSGPPIARAISLPSSIHCFMVSASFSVLSSRPPTSKAIKVSLGLSAFKILSPSI